MQLSIADLGSIGELVGSIAVLFTLVYLAIQVRHSRELLERNEKLSLGQAFQSRIDARRDLEKIVISMADIVAESQAGQYSELCDADKLKMRTLASLWADWWDNNIYQSSLGFTSALNDEVTTAQFENILLLWKTAGVSPSARVLRWYEKKKKDEDKDKKEQQTPRVSE